jgi:polar amino acid transport system ATP-binding protein
MEIVRVENLHKKFGKLHVLKGIDLSVSRGEIISVIGPSGSGKSTLLRCLNHLESADMGSISFEGEFIAKADKNGNAVYKKNKDVLEICSRLGMVFQNFNLFPHKTALENLLEAPLTVKKVSKAEAEKKAMELLGKVGMLEKKDAYPGQLSGGQQQRVAIARALAMEPEIMLFDEPTSALDPELIGEVLEVIKQLAAESMTMIIVTHEMAFAREISDRVVFMDDGKIIDQGPPERIFIDPEHPRVQTFLGKIIQRNG